MKAVVVREFGGPEVLRVADIDMLAPSASQVLVRVRAAGVNPVDSYVRAGAYASKPSLPYTPGTDGAGTVEAVGSDVTGINEGDRVYLASDNTTSPRTGTYAEFALCAPTQLHPLPDRMSFAQGAAVGVPYGTAYRALFNRARAKPGETVLVHGATGGVGIASVELAHAHGLRVIGTGGTERGLEAVRAHGADVVVNHREPGYLDVVMRETGGRGVDLVLEMAAHLNLDKDLGLLAKHGRVVVIGNRGRVEIDARQAMGREAAILGMLLFNSPPAELAEMHAALAPGLSDGSLNPLVGRELPLTDAPLAHELVLQPGALGKIVLVP